MTTHEARAAKLYGATTAPAKPPRPLQAHERLWPRSYGGSSDNYGAPLASYYDRRLVRLRDGDVEGRATARLERRQVAAFARKRGISSQDLHAALAVVHEQDTHPKSEEAIQKRWGQAFEELSAGGQENARKLLTDYAALTSDLAQEVPSLADRAGRSGAANDVRVIKALAHYGAKPTTTEEK